MSDIFDFSKLELVVTNLCNIRYFCKKLETVEYTMKYCTGTRDNHSSSSNIENMVYYNNLCFKKHVLVAITCKVAIGKFSQMNSFRKHLFAHYFEKPNLSFSFNLTQNSI